MLLNPKIKTWVRYLGNKTDVEFKCGFNFDRWFCPLCVNRNNAVSAEQKVLLTLRYYATGSLIRATSEFSGIHNSAGSRIIRLVSRRLALLRPEFVGFPEGKKEIAKVRQDFFNIAKVPGCIGSVDGSWVKIQSPGGNDAEVNRSRKGFFALKVMAICDAELKFENIVCRWPGRADDSTVFDHSTIRGKFEANLMGNHLLVGDSGYTPTNYLLTPLREPVTEGERNYNESLIRTHVCIERAFGVWKRRFPVLATGINVEITTVECIVVATVVLHNIARHFGDQIPRVTRDLEDLINLTNVDPADNDEIPHNYNLNRPLRQTEIINSFSSM